MFMAAYEPEREHAMELLPPMMQPWRKASGFDYNK